MSSTRSCPSSSTNNNSTSNISANHMPARRANAAAAAASSSSQLGTSTSAASSKQQQQQQHVADKSAVKRKKRRKDEDEEQKERLPVVLLTRLEDERKPKPTTKTDERKATTTTTTTSATASEIIKSKCVVDLKVVVEDVKVVVERASEAGIIRAASIDKSLKATRHPVHKSSENLTVSNSSDAKTSEPIRQREEKKKKVVVIEPASEVGSVRAASSDKSLKATTRHSVHKSSENLANGGGSDAKTLEPIREKAEVKKVVVVIEPASEVGSVRAASGDKSLKATTRHSVHKSSENLTVSNGSDAKTSEPIRPREEKKKKVVSEPASEAGSIKATTRHSVHRSNETLASSGGDAKTLEPIGEREEKKKVVSEPASEVGSIKATTRHSVHRSNEILASTGGDAKTLEPIGESEKEKKVAVVAIEEIVKAPPPPKKSIESAKKPESKKSSSKVKKPAESDVHNVNNRKTVDPKITEQQPQPQQQQQPQPVVRLDKTEVADYLEKKRLQQRLEDTEKHHSESETQDEEVETCAIPSDAGKIQETPTPVADVTDKVEPSADVVDKVEQTRRKRPPRKEKTAEESDKNTPTVLDVTDKMEQSVDDTDRVEQMRRKQPPRKDKTVEETEKNQRLSTSTPTVDVTEKVEQSLETRRRRPSRNDKATEETDGNTPIVQDVTDKVEQKVDVTDSVEQSVDVTDKMEPTRRRRTLRKDKTAEESDISTPTKQKVTDKVEQSVDVTDKVEQSRRQPPRKDKTSEETDRKQRLSTSTPTVEDVSEKLEQSVDTRRRRPSRKDQTAEETDGNQRLSTSIPTLEDVTEKVEPSVETRRRRPSRNDKSAEDSDRNTPIVPDVTDKMEQSLDDTDKVEQTRRKQPPRKEKTVEETDKNQRLSTSTPTVDVTERVEQSVETRRRRPSRNDKTAEETDKNQRVSTSTPTVEDVTEKVEPSVESRRRRPSRNDKISEETDGNQRLSTSREKRRAKSQDNAPKGKKDLRDDTKIQEDSSEQAKENQIECPKDTSRKSARSKKVAGLSSESLGEKSAVIDGVSSETTETNELDKETIVDSKVNSEIVTEPVVLPMEVDATPVTDDSKADSESAQQTCDIHSKNVDEDAKETLPVDVASVDESVEDVVSKCAEAPAESLAVDGESPVESLATSDSAECPAKISEESVTCKDDVPDSETCENLVNGEVASSPTDSFVSCENADENNDLIETIEDTESTASTCTLIEETPEELSKELEDLPEDDVEDKPLEEDVHKDAESVEELPEVAEKADDSFAQEDKVNEHESTFENNLKSVENLVIDSILNGEIVSPKMIVPSTAGSRASEVQSFVFDGGVEDFDKVVSEPSTPTDEVTPAVVAETLTPSVPIEEPAAVAAESSENTLPSVEPEAIATEEPADDEEFAKHRRKHALSELKKKCEENIASKAQLETDDDHPPASDEDSQVPSSALSSDSYCAAEPMAISPDDYFENVSDDADSDVCLSDRLNQLSNLKIPSLDDEPSLAEEAVLSEGEESTRSDGTKRQRILMKITKTDANEHVTHLVDSKDEEQQFVAADQVTEGEIKIIMRKESSGNNHVIKEIKIIPRTPEGNNSARIPGYSPTSSDLSSGNSSCRVPSCSPAKPDSGSYRMPGWSPASIETTTSTMKKKQGRPKKYPIFTDAELIAKTTAIVNNVDVQHANKIVLEKPLFEPVESIRINEDDEVERDDEEEHQTIITQQTCLSGSQLLEAMPGAQPEILEKLKKLEEDQTLAKKKKKMGRPRKYPLAEEVASNKPRIIEDITIRRIEFNVVDSIEEFVEPAKDEIPMVSPVKRARGRPRKIPLDSSDAATSAVEESDSLVVESVLIHDAPSERKVREVQDDDDVYANKERNSCVTGEDSIVPAPKEKRGRKPYKHLKDQNKTAEGRLIGDGADSQTEDEAPTKKKETRGRKPWKHLKHLENQAAAESADSQTEDEAPKKVERRGRKPWKHLKHLNEDAEQNTSATETASDASPIKEKKETRGRKPWKHLKNLENQAAESADSQTEDEAPVAPPTKEKRGRKPWKHLKNLENLAAESADSQTEDELPVFVIRVQPRGRTPRKHLENVDKVADGADSQTEDETPAQEKRKETRGRKPWKHLKEQNKTAEGQVAEETNSQTENQTTHDESQKLAESVEVAEAAVANDAISMTEDESADETTCAESKAEDASVEAKPHGERRRRKPSKHLKNLDKSAESHFADGADSQTEDDAPTQKLEKRGRKPWKHLKNLNQDAQQNMSTTENETASDASPTKLDAPKRGRKKKFRPIFVEGEKRPRGRPRKYPMLTEREAEEETMRRNVQAIEGESIFEPIVQLEEGPIDGGDTASTENVITEEAASKAESEILSDAPLSEVVAKKKRGRKSLKNTDDTITSVAEETDLMTEEESADETTLAEKAPTVVSSPEKKKRGRPPKIAREAESDTSLVSAPLDGKRQRRPRLNSQDESMDGTGEVKKYVEKRGRKPWKHLKNLEKPLESQESPAPENAVAAVEPSSVTEDETVSSTEDIPTGDNIAVDKVSPVKIPKPTEEPSSSQTEDETVSSTEDIPTVEQPKSSDGTLLEGSTTSMEPPTTVRKRGRPKIARQADSTNDATEDETVSSTEDIPVGAERVTKRKQDKPRKNLPLPSVDMDTNDSLAASSVEDPTAMEVPAGVEEKRGDDSTLDENSSMAASSIEDLSAIVPPLVLKKKRGRKPKASSMEDPSTPPVVKRRGRPPKIPRLPEEIVSNVSADSIEEFSPTKQQQPDDSSVTPKVLERVAATLYQTTFDNEQPAYERVELSPTKKRGRPPKYPKAEAPKQVSFSDDPEQIPILEKRKGRLPRRLSQDENILPSILKMDSPRRSSHDSGSSPNDHEIVPSLGKRQARPPRKFSPDEDHHHHSATDSDSTKKAARPPSILSDSDDASSTASGKRRGRPPKKFAMEDGFTSGGETSPTKRKGRPPKFVFEENLSLSRPTISDSESNNELARATATPTQENTTVVPIVPPPVVSNTEETIVKKPAISTTNLLRQQRKPRMAQPQLAAPTPSPPTPAAVVVESVPQQQSIPTQPQPQPQPQTVVSPTKKRGRPKLPSFDLSKHNLPDGLTIEQLRRRRHSQDDSMFTDDLPVLAARPKEFEDTLTPKKRRGRPPRDFVLEQLKPKAVEARKESEVVQEERRESELTAADYLRTWTDRDDSPAPQQTQTVKKVPARQRRFSQDDSILSENFSLEESRPSSRNRLRRYSQGDALDESSNDEMNTRKRLRSSGSDGSIGQDEKRPRVERELCDQHSITKELVVQLTKLDNSDESQQPPTTPIAQPISSELVRMSLRRKLESNNNAASEPPPLVPIEPNRLQPPTHSDAKLLMLMQPQPEPEKMTLQATPQPQQQQQLTTTTATMQPPTQQFCIIFIPDALTSSESSLNKDIQPTATIVNFQPVPDAEVANKSVIYTPTTPTKIYVNNEELNNRAFLCANCTKALDTVARLEANMGITEADKCAIKCPCCPNHFQSLFYLEYHLRQEHLKCENEKQCRHSGFNTLRITSHDTGSSESEIYITFALKCRSCYELFENVHKLNEHVMVKHANLIRHKPPLSSGMVCYPPPPFKNGARPEVLHCPSDCICRIGIRSTDSPMQRAQMLKRCPNFMRRLEKIEAAAYEVYTCTLCMSTFLMKDEVVEHLMKMHEVACKFPCTKCLASFRSVQLQESHHCSETTIRDLDKLVNIVIMPTDKGHDNSKFEDSSNDELGPIKTTPPPAVPSASTPLNGLKRKNGVVIQRLTRFLAMQPPKKPRLDPVTNTPISGKYGKRQKTPCPKCQKKFAYRKSLNDHIIFEHIIPCKADEASKNMAVELLRLVNTVGSDHSKIEELATALGKYTDDEGVSLKKLTRLDEQENWNEAQHDGDVVQCLNCKVNFKVPGYSANLSRRNNQRATASPIPQLCERCDPTRRRRQNTVNNGHSVNLRSPANGEPEGHQVIVRYNYECDQCGDTFPTGIELNSHKSVEHGNKPSEALKCDACPKIFYSSRMLDKHKKLQHDANGSMNDSLLSNCSTSSSTTLQHDESMDCSSINQSLNVSVGDVSKESDAANDTANSSTSRRDSSDNSKEEEKCKCPRCDFASEKVGLKNHLKREHGVMAFICQFCGKLLVEISEVRHMLDYHIKSSSRKNTPNPHGFIHAQQDEVSELLRTLGKRRLQALMIYHDFEGKCNNAIMRCPICPEQFATRESCRHHYQWMHDCTCILCDASFTGGNVAGQHKVAVHNSIASYVWAIQRLVSAIVHGMRLDRAHPSQVLYQEVSLRLDLLEQESLESYEAAMRLASKPEETVAAEPFLEPVVLSEDQLPGSGNMIEVVIGNDMVVEDSEDNLLENFYLSPNYESSCEQPRILDAGAHMPELEDEEEVVAHQQPAPVAAVMTTTTTTTVALPATPSLTTSNGGILIPTTPVTADTYATSAVFKLRQDNGQEEVVLAITDEDLVTYRDDIGSLAEKLSATCDSLSLEEITTMLRSYFENVGTTPLQTEEVEFAASAGVEPARTQ